VIEGNTLIGIFVEIFDPVSTLGVLRREGVTDVGGATQNHLACLAAQRRDPARGERCCAVVQLKETNSELGFEEMTAFCREQGLMTQKIPEQLEVVKQIPRNPVGKVLKHELRKQYRAD
jgi:non-ribosomal peptide synthetase component E (peptide arylation enzyme)